MDIFEEYAEIIDQVPQNIQDLLHKIKASSDNDEYQQHFIEAKQQAFMLQCQHNALNDEAYRQEYESIKRLSEAALHSANERVEMIEAAQCLMQRFLQRLDDDIATMQHQQETTKTAAAKLQNDELRHLEQHTKNCNKKHKSKKKESNEKPEREQEAHKAEVTAHNVVAKASTEDCALELAEDLDNVRCVTTRSKQRTQSKQQDNTRAKTTNNCARKPQHSRRKSVLPAAEEIELPRQDKDKIYCICNNESYGKMIACDNSACPYEWFHYECVEIVVAPRGDWYCPECRFNTKRRQKISDRSYKI